MHGYGHYERPYHYGNILRQWCASILCASIRYVPRKYQVPHASCCWQCYAVEAVIQLLSSMFHIDTAALQCNTIIFNDRALSTHAKERRHA